MTAFNESPMKKLCFSCRTWNRAEVLELTVSRRAEEIEKFGLQDRVIIFLIDNCSSDHTPKVIKKLKNKYPFIIAWRSPTWKKQEEPFQIPKEIVEATKAEFTWIFGDDDLLLKDTLPLVWKILNSENAKQALIIHTGNALNKPHSYKVYPGTVLMFANLMGFNQFIGWAASIITNNSMWHNLAEKHRIYYLEKLGQKFWAEVWPEYWKVYKEAAFSYVLTILHLFSQAKALVIDYPICEPLKHFDADTGERWERENIGWRYFLFVRGLKFMYDRGILQTKLKPKFFKYLNHYLWDRFLIEMIASRLGIYTRNPRPDEGWQYILDIADLLDDAETANYIRETTYRAKTLAEEYLKIQADLKTLPKNKIHRKKILSQKAKNIKTQLLNLYEEAVRPKFQEGWAGEGYQDYVEKEFTTLTTY
ncbi:MAG: hypothetical protein NZ530_06790 [Thermodesulfobacteriaceae bacterium]|nr:hypothetical protein [Thermodesulfobacteriaceae bacterium]MDW8135764.1 hypothetical protein [Thermodesulfobacterium sp.]